MILYLANAYHLYTIETWVDSWGKPLRRSVEILDYLSIPNVSSFKANAVIFTDHERFSKTEREMAVRLWDAFRSESPDTLLFNDPREVITRSQLLDRLWESGVNRFRAFPARALEEVSRFPVFIRHASEHTGPLTELLDGRPSLRAEMKRLLEGGLSTDELLIVEFVDVSDGSELFPKYAAFRIGDLILPRAVGFSRHWVQKEPDIATTETISLEIEYMANNPHEEWIRSVFEGSGITYGRIDYGLVSGVPQAFEINTNPIIQLHASEYRRLQLPVQPGFADRMMQVLGELDRRGSGRRFSLQLSREEREGISREVARQRVERKRDPIRLRIFRRRHLRNAIQNWVSVLQWAYRRWKGL